MISVFILFVFKMCSLGPKVKLHDHSSRVLQLFVEQVTFVNTAHVVCWAGVMVIKLGTPGTTSQGYHFCILAVA